MYSLYYMLISIRNVVYLYILLQINLFTIVGPWSCFSCLPYDSYSEHPGECLLEYVS